MCALHCVLPCRLLKHCILIFHPLFRCPACSDFNICTSLTLRSIAQLPNCTHAPPRIHPSASHSQLISIHSPYISFLTRNHAAYAQRRPQSVNRLGNRPRSRASSRLRSTLYVNTLPLLLTLPRPSTSPACSLLLNTAPLIVSCS